MKRPGNGLLVMASSRHSLITFIRAVSMFFFYCLESFYLSLGFVEFDFYYFFCKINDFNYPGNDKSLSHCI